MSVGRRRRLYHVDDLGDVIDGLTFKEWISRYIADHDERHTRDNIRDETAVHTAVTASQHAVETALAASQHALEAALAAVKHEGDLHRENHAREHAAHEKAHAAEQVALDKAEVAMTRRLEGMNEFRNQLREQSGMFATRESVETRFESIEREFRLLVDGLRGDIQTLRETDQRSAGRGAGLASGWGYLLGAVATVVLIVNLVFYLISR